MKTRRGGSMRSSLFSRQAIPGLRSLRLSGPAVLTLSDPNQRGTSACPSVQSIGRVPIRTFSGHERNVIDLLEPTSSEDVKSVNVPAGGECSSGDLPSAILRGPCRIGLAGRAGSSSCRDPPCPYGTAIQATHQIGRGGPIKEDLALHRVCTSHQTLMRGEYFETPGNWLRCPRNRPP